MLDSDQFFFDVPEAEIAELRARLARVRWPDEPPLAPWSVGSSLAYLQELVAYWRDRFDWRRQEAALNAFPQYRIEQDGCPLHFLHVQGVGPAPTPLLLLHGWPGSVFEFLDLIPLLSDPARFGGDAADAFTVIAPSLPGYGLSFRPGQRRFGVSDIADSVLALMRRLGHERFAIQGGDWGAHIATNLGVRAPEALLGLHLNLLSLSTSETAGPDATKEERRYYNELAHWNSEQSGYTAIQGTRPQTLAFALADSPVGLAAWIAEKFHAWSDNDGTIESAIDRDRMLGNISFYWFTGSIGASFWPYYARLHGDAPLPPGRTVDVPVGYAAFPREIRRPPRSIAARHYTDIRRWTAMPKGGHFAALEQPEALAAEVTAFFRALRTTS